MNNIEKELNKMKKDLENIQVPDELESILRQGLDKTPKKRRFNYKSLIAAAAIAIFFIGYNADALAYYGKKLIGYDTLMNGTLKELNQLENGQIIDKSYEFKDGKKLTLDAIMLDTNSLIMFYTLYDPSGNIGKFDSDLGMLDLKGYGLYNPHGGQGISSQDEKEMKWILTYDPPKFFEKAMKLVFNSSSSGEEGKIDFKLDRNKAMSESLKIDINKKYQLFDRKIKIDSLIASPMTTRIKGDLQNIAELGLDKIKGERIYFESLNLQLLADGESVDLQNSSIGRGNKGAYFDFTFNALDKDTKEIELKLNSFEAREDTDKEIELAKGKMNKTVNLLEEDILINEVFEKDGNTYVNITTEESIYLTDLYLEIDGKNIRNERTIDENYDKVREKDNTNKVLRSRTVEFKGKGEKLKLVIKEIKYKKVYDQTIYKENIR